MDFPAILETRDSDVVHPVRKTDTVVTHIVSLKLFCGDVLFTVVDRYRYLVNHGLPAVQHNTDHAALHRRLVRRENDAEAADRGVRPPGRETDQAYANS